MASTKEIQTNLDYSKITKSENEKVTASLQCVDKKNRDFKNLEDLFLRA